MEIQKDVRSKIKDILTKELGINEEKVKDDKRIQEDLGADSLAKVELVMALEEQFGIEIPDDEALQLLTVGDVINFIEKKVNITGGRTLTE